MESYSFDEVRGWMICKFFGSYQYLGGLVGGRRKFIIRLAINFIFSCASITYDFLLSLSGKPKRPTIFFFFIRDKIYLSCDEIFRFCVFWLIGSRYLFYEVQNKLKASKILF